MPYPAALARPAHVLERTEAGSRELLLAVVNGYTPLPNLMHRLDGAHAVEPAWTGC